MPTRHEIPVTDDESVVAVHHEPSPDSPTDDGVDRADTWLVFCHGFLSDKAGSYEGRCRRATAEGYHGVRFDFRGCGEADGDFVDQTLSEKIRDLRAVVEYFAPEKLVLFGSSFGAKVAFHAVPVLTATNRSDLVALAGRAPVTLNQGMDATLDALDHDGPLTFETGQSIDERFVVDLQHYPFERVVDDVECPVYLAHGDEDESVAIEDTFEAAAQLETDVLLEKVLGEGHLFSAAAEERLRTRLFDWLASLE